MIRTTIHPHRTSDDNSGCAAILILVVLLVGIAVTYTACGVGGFGPTAYHTVTVKSKHVDLRSDSSHYMVVTDQGVFECDNGILLGIWNADELYGQLQDGKTYYITTKGKKHANILLQEYPYIVKVEEMK